MNSFEDARMLVQMVMDTMCKLTYMKLDADIQTSARLYMDVQRAIKNMQTIHNTLDNMQSRPDTCWYEDALSK